MDPGDHSDSESESDSDEEDLVDAKGFKLELKKRQYEVEFSQTGGYGMALEPAGHKKSSLGAKVKRVQEESAADTSGKVKPGHFIMAIGSKDVTKSTVEAVNKALKRAPKPVTITFEVRVKHRIDSGSSGLDGAGAMNSEDARPSHVYLQREWTTHDQLTFEDYINVLTVCSSRLAHETELMKRIVFLWKRATSPWTCNFGGMPGWGTSSGSPMNWGASGGQRGSGIAAPSSILS